MGWGPVEFVGDQLTGWGESFQKQNSKKKMDFFLFFFYLSDRYWYICWNPKVWEGRGGRENVHSFMTFLCGQLPWGWTVSSPLLPPLLSSFLRSIYQIQQTNLWKKNKAEWKRDKTWYTTMFEKFVLNILSALVCVYQPPLKLSMMISRVSN